MFKNRIASKIWLAMISIVIPLFLILGGVFPRLFANFYFSQQSQKIAREGRVLAQLVVSPEEEGVVLQQLDLLERFLGAHIMVVDREGLIRGHSPGMGQHSGRRIDLSDLEDVAPGEALVHWGQHHHFDVPMLSVAVPVVYRDEVKGAVFLYTPEAPFTETVTKVRRIILYVSGGGIIVATILAFILSRSLSQPLVQMNKVAQAMARGDFKRRVSVGSQDEVGRLGETLNYLSTRLAGSLDSLSQEKERLQNILSSMTDGVITFNPEGFVLLSNPPARNLLGGEIPWDGPLNRWGIPGLGEIFREVVRAESAREGLISWRQRELAVRLSLLRGIEGEINGVVVLFQDVTREQELDKLRRDFVANVSHELRTPLSFLQGYGEALLDGLARTPQEEKQYLEIILEETLRLRHLVDDLLDLAQLEAGHLPMEMGEVHLSRLTEKVLSMVKPTAQGRGIDILADIPPNLPPVIGNQQRLRQVLYNLLDNALRHTPPGGKITVRGRQVTAGLEVRVEDNGSGISPAELPYIWERFYKLDKARTRTTGGTGLGLSIVKNIIQAHGGEITAASGLGEGTTFTFLLPIPGAEEKAGICPGEVE